MEEYIEKYKKLLMSGISYQDLKFIVEYDYYIFKSKERAILECESCNEAELDMICQIPTIIKSRENAYENFRALRMAYNSLYQAEKLLLRLDMTKNHH